MEYLEAIILSLVVVVISEMARKLLIKKVLK